MLPISNLLERRKQQPENQTSVLFLLWNTYKASVKARIGLRGQNTMCSLFCQAKEKLEANINHTKSGYKETESHCF